MYFRQEVEPHYFGRIRAICGSTHVFVDTFSYVTGGFAASRVFSLAAVERFDLFADADDMVRAVNLAIEHRRRRDEAKP